MEISAKLVKELRDKTGAGMMDCKRALIEMDGDLTTAAEYLRKKGLMDAAKKSSRTASDGLIACYVQDDRKTATIIEMNAETDFVARNEKFQDVVARITRVAVECDSVDEILEAKFPGTSKTVREEIDSLIAVIGENMNLRRGKRISVKNGVISSYIHGAIISGMGKIGVLVALEWEGEFDHTAADELGKKLAMHIAAASPAYLCSKCVPQDVIDKEKEIVLAQAKDTGKPDNIAVKMAEGRIKKFFEENVLLEQVFVIDGKTKVADFVDNFNKQYGAKLSISSFTKFVLGEGIEKRESNFAEEVRSFVG
ncbi:MAG: translation elongation factor Ts [Holosporales bacterium]|jgi:elongation factor Ts|nr:translation elongation factor Ts [Holosporales bacterium]